MEDRIGPKYSIASYLLFGWLAAFLGWWFFALSPLPETSPQWVETARKVCFGSLPNGLPEGYGWLTLVCSPLLMLTALVLIWPRELGQDLRKAKSSPLGRLLLIGLVILPALSLAWGVQRVVQLNLAYEQAVGANFDNEELPETYPRYDDGTPQFNLVNQYQQTVTLESLRGRPLILTFAFAHCGSICPGLVSTVMEGANTYSGERPVVVFITLDPWRDTPSSLPTLAKQWQLKPGDHVLSGPVDEVYRVIEAYKVTTARNTRNGDISHPGMAFIFDSEGRLIYRFNDPSVSWIHQALDRL